MIIKLLTRSVKDNPDEPPQHWMLIDNAEEVVGQRAHRDFETYEQLVEFYQNIVSDDVMVEINHKARPTTCAILAFRRQGKHHVMVFDTALYIMNDQGKTIDNIRVS